MLHAVAMRFCKSVNFRQNGLTHSIIGAIIAGRCVIYNAFLIFFLSKHNIIQYNGRKA